MPSKRKGPAKSPPKKKAKPSPKGRRGRGKKTSPTPQAPGPLADAAADAPAPRSPSPPYDSSREPSPESRSSSVASESSAGSNRASVTSPVASTSTVASVSSKAKRKAWSQRNTSSLTLQEENQMVDWLEDNPIMWNTLMMDYKCRDKKNKLWEDQAAIMGKPYETIFTWYTSARDTHTKLIKTTSGSGAQRLTERESWLLERFKFRKVVQRTKAAPMKSLKATIEAHAGDLEAAEAACAEVGAAVVELDTPTPTSSRKQRRPQEDPDIPLLSALQESVQQSGEIPKDLAAQRHPVKPTARSTFANYVKDSLLSMSNKKYKTAMRDINKVLSDLMLVDIDEEDMEIPTMKPTLSTPNIRQLVRPCSAPAFGAASSPSPSEQYQPMPAMWKHQPPPSSVWTSQTPEYMEGYFQQPDLTQPPLQYQMLPPPTHTILQPRQRTQQPSSTASYLQQGEQQQPPGSSSSSVSCISSTAAATLHSSLPFLDGSINLGNISNISAVLDTSLLKDAEEPMNTPPPQEQ